MSPPSRAIDAVLTSFCTAWLCAVAHHRHLLPPRTFTKIAFGNTTVDALRPPSPNGGSLLHIGLYYWLVRDAARVLKGRRDAVVRVVVRDGEDVTEMHEMRCVEGGERGPEDVAAEGIRAQTGVVLRALRSFFVTMEGRGIEVSVVVGGEEEVEGLRGVRVGSFGTGECEVVCSVFVLDE